MYVCMYICIKMPRMSYIYYSLLIINTNDIDFVNNKNDLKEILNVIRSPIKGTKYYNPFKDSNIKT